jgi:hypothetical protein
VTTPVFSAAWFRRHQWPLLALLATPVIGRELRDALAIRRCDVGWDRRIVRVYRHAYTVANPDGSFSTDFRTAPKYARRLRSQFDGIWRAAHAWDRFVANPLVPALNVGFDTLDVRPDPDPEVLSFDGRASRQGVDETWATIIAGTGNSVSDATTTISTNMIQASTTASQFALCMRGLFLWDTHDLTSNASLSSAIASLFGSSKEDGLSALPDVDWYTSSPASDTGAASGDYASLGSTSQTGAPIGYAGWSTSAYNDFTLNATGRGSIALTGITKFGTRSNYDAAASTPPWVSGATSRLISHAADAGGSANDPKLVVTFTLLTLPQVGLFDPELVPEGWF